MAELRSTPAQFRWGINGQWRLSCSDGSSAFVSTNFDSLGVTNLGCARSWSGTIGPTRVQQTYRIDCGADGAITASWDLAAPAP